MGKGKEKLYPLSSQPLVGQQQFIKTVSKLSESCDRLVYCFGKWDHRYTMRGSEEMRKEWNVNSAHGGLFGD